MKKSILFLSIICLLFACESKKQAPVLSSSNGRMNHLLLVVENSQWHSDIGKKLREIIKTPVLAMPQEENIFDISRVPMQSFGKMFKASKSILIIEIGKENSLHTARNLYAKPQQIVKIVGIKETDIVGILEENKEKIISTFRDFDIEIVQKNHTKKAYPINTFKTLKKLEIKMTIPKFFNLVDDTGIFLWLRQHLSGGIAKGDGTSNLLIYTIPIPTDKNDIVATISKMRNMIGEKYIPGGKENTYMITEKAFVPIVFETKLNNMKTYETRGKWELLNDFMAGPFLNYAIEDTRNNRWIVVEGFSYAPSVDKRDYMFELEAILKTINF